MSSVLPFLHSQASSTPTYHSHFLYPKNALWLHFFALRDTNMMYWNGPNRKVAVIIFLGFSTAISCRSVRIHSSPKAAGNPHFSPYQWIFDAYNISGNFGICFRYYQIVDGDVPLELEGDYWIQMTDICEAWKLKCSHCILWCAPKINFNKFSETCKPLIVIWATR